MPTIERIETWCGQEVLDSAGEKVGRLEEVYYDSAHEPVLLAVKHGRLGRQTSLIPVSEAVLCRDYVRLPYTADQIHRSEVGSGEDELTGDQVAAVGVLFNVALPSSGSIHGAKLLERRRIEAERAERRAHELELEAERRAEELEEARRRAGAAAEQARTAEREREKAEAEAASLETTPESTPRP